MSKVSVIIPTWNRVAALEKAVRSALLQTHSDIEVLVCDDGSTDNSKELVEAIGDSRVRWIEGPRGGRPAIPRNRGIEESRGEWLAFLDSDDEWLPEKLIKQLACAQQMGAKAICSNAYRVNRENGVLGELLSMNKNHFSFFDLLICNSVICSSSLIHSSLIDDVIGFPESESLKAIEDYALWLRVSTLSNFVYCPEPLLNYLDDPINSIRDPHGSVWPQRNNVLHDFLTWGRGRKHVRMDQVNAARRALLVVKWKLLTAWSRR
jgi:glycosyltransferase involved in cell wall biosynthesis